MHVKHTYLCVLSSICWHDARISGCSLGIAQPVYLGIVEVEAECRNGSVTLGEQLEKLGLDMGLELGLAACYVQWVIVVPQEFHFGEPVPFCGELVMHWILGNINIPRRYYMEIHVGSAI